MYKSILVSTFVSIAVAIHFLACGSSPKAGSAVVEDAESPVVGAAISFSDITVQEINISVGVATDNKTEEIELEYKVVQAASDSDINTIAKANAMTGDSIVQDWIANMVDFTHDGLIPATNYCYAVLVRDAAKNMAIYAPDCQATAGDITPPVRGTGIAFTAVEGDEMTISVGASTDTVTPASNLSYKFVTAATGALIDTTVEIEAISGPNLLQDWTANDLSVNHEGLVPNTSYCYAVLVKDAANNITRYTQACRTTANIKRIFVTASSYNGNLGGTAGADAKCAADANKPATGTYSALIADFSRIAQVGSQVDWVLLPSKAYTRADGVTPIGTTTADSIFTFPLTNSIGTSAASVWVGLLDSDWSNADNCMNWIDDMATGGFGAATSTSGTAINNPSAACSAMYRLYCVED